MAETIRVMASGNMARHPGYREFFVDTPADIALLPNTPEEIAWGACALVISTGTVFILNSEYQWVVMG